MLLADEATRCVRRSIARRAQAAHLDPQMQLQGLVNLFEVQWE
jgi:hypothetical protein